MGRVEVPKQLQRGRSKDEVEARRSAIALLGVLAEKVGRPDLGEVDVLDVGCGVKFTQALLEEDIPIGSYTGVDVHAPVIETLRSTVTDLRFSFHHVDFFNGRYNPGGRPMTADAVLPVGDDTFDLICGFSLFTHLDPTDTASMLSIMRRCARADTRLVATVFVDRLTEGGFGVMDAYARALGPGVVTGEPFRDYFPDDVLRVALYGEDHLREIIAASDWDLVSLDDPTRWGQHLMTLVPTAA